MCVYVIVIVIVDGEWGIEMGIWGGGGGMGIPRIGGNWRELATIRWFRLDA